MGSVFWFRQSGWLYSGVKQMASDSVCLAVWLTGICSSWHGNSHWHRLAPLWDGFLLWMGKQAKFKFLLPVYAQQQVEAQLLLSHVSFWPHQSSHHLCWWQTWYFKVKRNLLVRLETAWIGSFYIYKMNFGQPTLFFILEFTDISITRTCFYRGFLPHNKISSCSNYY